jgi:hypothetical protein
MSVCFSALCSTIVPVQLYSLQQTHPSPRTSCEPLYPPPSDEFTYKNYSYFVCMLHSDLLILASLVHCFLYYTEFYVFFCCPNIFSSLLIFTL